MRVLGLDASVGYLLKRPALTSMEDPVASSQLHPSEIYPTGQQNLEKVGTRSCEKTIGRQLKWADDKSVLPLATASQGAHARTPVRASSCCSIRENYIRLEAHAG